jgi:hypothetical protein
MHVDRAKVQRSTHLVVEACVAHMIVGRSTPVRECHFHGLWYFSGNMAAVNSTDLVLLTDTSVLIPSKESE